MLRNMKYLGLTLLIGLSAKAEFSVDYSKDPVIKPIVSVKDFLTYYDLDSVYFSNGRYPGASALFLALPSTGLTTDGENYKFLNINIPSSVKHDPAVVGYYYKSITKKELENKEISFDDPAIRFNLKSEQQENKCVVDGLNKQFGTDYAQLNTADIAKIDGDATITNKALAKLRAIVTPFRMTEMPYGPVYASCRGTTRMPLFDGTGDKSSTHAVWFSRAGKIGKPMGKADALIVDRGGWHVLFIKTKVLAKNSLLIKDLYKAVGKELGQEADYTYPEKGSTEVFKNSVEVCGNVESIPTKKTFVLTTKQNEKYYISTDSNRQKITNTTFIDQPYGFNPSGCTCITGDVGDTTTQLSSPTDTAKSVKYFMTIKSYNREIGTNRCTKGY